MSEIYESRYRQKRYIKKLEENKYFIYGESHYMRIIGGPAIEAIDFEGGPYVSVGTNLKVLGYDEDKTVIKINPSTGGYVLITK